jgi:hypothetical protein
MSEGKNPRISKRLLAVRPPVNASAGEIERYLRAVSVKAGNEARVQWQTRLEQPYR